MVQPASTNARCVPCHPDFRASALIPLPSPSMQPREQDCRGITARPLRKVRYACCAQLRSQQTPLLLSPVTILLDSRTSVPSLCLSHSQTYDQAYLAYQVCLQLSAHELITGATTHLGPVDSLYSGVRDRKAHRPSLPPLPSPPNPPSVAHNHESGHFRSLVLVLAQHVDGLVKGAVEGEELPYVLLDGPALVWDCRRKA